MPSEAVSTTEYPISEEEQKRLDNNFTYHSPNPDQQARYPLIRSSGKAMARKILRLTPPSRERSLALTKLEEAIMWANAAIARNENDEEST